MPKAAKPKTQSRANPLAPKSSNATKKGPSTSKSTQAKPASPEKDVSIDANSPSMIPTAGAGHADYLLMINMTLSYDPMISRILSLPPSTSFAKLHAVLQIAFGWANCHMHTFTVDVPPVKKPGDKYAFPKTVLQLETDPTDMGIEPKPQAEADWTLEDVFEKQDWKDEEGNPIEADGPIQLQYEYDMGDSWQHQITLLGRADKHLHESLGGKGAPKGLCLGGEGHPCAEDCGSEPGWQNLKDAFKKARGDKDLKEWYKRTCSNGDPKGLDPYKWDILKVNDGIGKLFA